MTQTLVLVSGANQGLGFEIVKKLAAEQADYHILLGARDRSKGQDAAARVTTLASNTTVTPIDLDITSDSSIEQCVALVEKQFGHLDVLMNNAGIGRAGQSTKRAEMLKLFDTNVASAACVTEAFLPLLRKAGVPRIVMMSSGLGSMTDTLDPSQPFYGYDAQDYSITKAGMNMLAATYAVKLSKDGFKVNSCDPGFRATGINGYNELAGKAEDGAVNACRLITLGKDGETGTFSSTEGPVRW